MSKYIPVNTSDPEFLGLMQGVTKAIRTGDAELMKKIKAAFAEADFSVFYNAETDEVRVLRKDCPPIDFAVSRFTDIPKATVK
jgi:hypothetical protein